MFNRLMVLKEISMGNNNTEKFKNIFRALNSTWLIRHYIFAGLALLIFKFMSTMTPGQMTFYFVSAIFYPFAMFIYESILNLLIGENFFILPIKFMLIWKVIRFCFVLTFAIPIGIIGLLYIYYKVNKN